MNTMSAMQIYSQIKYIQGCDKASVYTTKKNALQGVLII